MLSTYHVGVDFTCGRRYPKNTIFPFLSYNSCTYSENFCTNWISNVKLAGNFPVSGKITQNNANLGKYVVNVVGRLKQYG